MSAIRETPAAATPEPPAETVHTVGREWALARILVVARDEVWARKAREVLRAEGFAVEVDSEPGAVLSRLEAFRPDVVGVDLSLRGGSAVALCATVRSRSLVPVFAAAARADEADIVAALTAGADAFVAKDASPRELVARLRALLRRFPPAPATTPTPAAGTTGGGTVLRSGPIEMDTTTRAVTLDGTPVDVDGVALELLETLLRRPGKVVAKAELLAACGARADDDRVLELHIRRLREKLEVAGRARCIESVRGVGFRLDGSAP